MSLHWASVIFYSQKQRFALKSPGITLPFDSYLCGVENLKTMSDALSIEIYEKRLLVRDKKLAHIIQTKSNLQAVVHKLFH